MTPETLDYRNGKYQGSSTPARQRHGPGIFIDDDLTLYLSHWHLNKLHGPSLLYLAHGKYIYGLWQHHELSGLAVFRSGDTVLLAHFHNNFPTQRALIIFERYNFACVLEQGNREWIIVDSGPINTHNMLLKFIHKTGITVPQHYFSLTKFLTHFAEQDTHLVTAPCHTACTYFGYPNGLGFVFNANNGLVSVGLHAGDTLAEFGGKFDNSKTGCQGNFQKAGERVTYQGDRPVHQIYPIFQKLHKRSLNFVNQYFDSKVKIFTNVEDFLRKQLKVIIEECSKLNAGCGDLGDSLDYQDYTEEESFKLNSMRDVIYSQAAMVNKYSPVSLTNKKERVQTPIEQFEESQILHKFDGQNQKEQDSSKFFKKNGENLRGSEFNTGKRKIQQKNQQTPDLKTNNQEEYDYNKVVVFTARKSPYRINKQTTFRRDESPQKSKIGIHPITQAHNTLQSDKKYEKSNKELVEQKQQTKTKQKMKSNNLRYIQNYSNQAQTILKEDKNLKGISAVKTNNVYREINRRQNQESPQNYKVPTFRGLLEEIEQKKLKKNYKQLQKTQEYQSPNKQKQTCRNMTEITVSKKGQKSQAYHPIKPNYEQIQDRRKRILKQFRNINTQGKLNIQDKINTQGKLHTYSPQNAGVFIQYQTPTQGFVFSVPKQEEQGSFGMVPLSITPKKQQKEGSPSRQNNYKKNQPYIACDKPLQQKKNYLAPGPASSLSSTPGFALSPKEGLISYKVFLCEDKKKQAQYQKDTKYYLPQKPSPTIQNNTTNSKQNKNQNLNVKPQQNNINTKVSNWNKGGSYSPLKTKKSYQYLYQ